MSLIIGFPSAMSPFLSLLFVSLLPFAASFSVLHSRDPQYSEVMETIDLENTMTTFFLTPQRDKTGLHV